ncbi:MAG TPA: DegQ family serine endoprotease [Dongiaceae bacterium]|nr:DegQ family serine endoprotease [Dongiaceae bacterium]
MSRLGPFRFVLLAAALSLASGAASAQAVPSSRAEIAFSFSSVVKKTAPAVVNIYTRRVVESRAVSPLFNDPFFQQFFGNDFGFGVPQERVQNSLGSGVILRPDGLIVTNNHVIQKSDQITVVLSDRREFPAHLLLADDRIDLALLKIDPGKSQLPTLPLADSDQLEVGDLVLAIGNPFGVGQTVTSGIISALARTQVGIGDYGFFIQTDAAINPGNSGGALVTMDGKLAGINTAIYSKSGGSVGIGFAIPSNMVASFLAAELKGGHLNRPWIGVSGQAVTSDMAEALGLDHPTGIIVDDVFPGGPAAAAGLKRGDVIIAVNGKQVEDAGGLRFRLATLDMGGTATVTALRKGQRLELPVRLVAPPETPPAQKTQLSGAHPLAGAVVANLSPALAEELQLASEWKGVVIYRIARGTVAARLGLAPGDVILAVNGQTLASVNDLRRALEAANGSWDITFRRNGQTRTLRID